MACRRVRRKEPVYDLTLALQVNVPVRDEIEVRIRSGKTVELFEIGFWNQVLILAVFHGDGNEPGFDLLMPFMAS
jgi:hypothetical protein